MDKLDEIAKNYLYELLSEGNQVLIADTLRTYKNSEKDRLESFNTLIVEKIAYKQQRYDNLMKNLSSGVLPSEVVTDIGEEMKLIKAEIEALKAAEPPKDYTVEHVRNWLTSLKNSDEDAAVRLLIERIDIKNKTEYSMKSTLETVLGIKGREGRI